MISTEGVIFETVQKSKIFPDSKTFVDAIPIHQDKAILNSFKHIDCKNKKELLQFVQDNFSFDHEETRHRSKSFQSLEEYIEKTRGLLSRSDSDQKSSKIKLPYAYIVPGGRFRELYYWDTYFTAVGLAEEKRYHDIENLVKNFIYLQDQIGLIPNGSRVYYATRSQPPVLVLLVDLLYHHYGIHHIETYLPALKNEHDFWMSKRVIEIQGHKLNRYCDPQTTPRPESYIEDTELALSVAEKNQCHLLQAIRSAAESGWDFSSRWMSNSTDLSTTHTQDILPIDLNALLYILESKLSQYYEELGNNESANCYKAHAQERAKAYQEIFWDDNIHCYFDYNHRNMKLSTHLTAAISWALFAGLATKKQASKLKEHLETKLLKNGGIVTTTIESGEQWDAPNGWAPLQWIGAIGLKRYQFDALAEVIMIRWCNVVEQYYQCHGVVLEKYDVCNIANRPGMGEYEVQEGFGWTNGTYTAFKKLLK